MTPDPSLFIKRIRHLSWALMMSGALNIGVLSLLLYWVLKESPPTPYFELKPASSEQQQLPLADQRGCAEVLAQLSQLSLSQLVGCLSHTQLVENGYAERDLALACLIAFHHFDIQRALPRNAQPQQKRLLAWKPKGQQTTIMLSVYPDLTQNQFDSLIQFAKTERWPLTSAGLFLQLKRQKEKNAFEDHLLETFFLTPEFWTIELLFNRLEQRASRREILAVLLEGNWELLQQFVDQQRQLHDVSDARRQKFLLDYLKEGSSAAASLLLKTEWDFAVKKLDDQQVIAVLQLIPISLGEGMLFAKEMMISPRSANVWRQAAQWLYMQAGEVMPNNWTHQAALARFISEKTPVAFIPESPNISISANSSTSLGRNTTANKGVSSESHTLPASRSITQTDQKQSAPIKLTKSLASKKSERLNNKPIIYVVQKGDSLWKISKRFGVKVDEIKDSNHLKTDTLKPGAVLKIPRSSEKHPHKEN